VQMALVMSFSPTEVLAGHLNFEMYVALGKALVTQTGVLHRGPANHAMPWRLTTENRCRLCRKCFVPGYEFAHLVHPRVTVVHQSDSAERAESDWRATVTHGCPR
jgi:hypothetical protein